MTGGNTGVGGFDDDGDAGGTDDVLDTVEVDGDGLLAAAEDDGGVDEGELGGVLLEGGSALLGEEGVLCSASQVCSWVPYPALSKKLS